ncbi:hypothetical protein Afil01_20510 [Actinorhabdospora filicis]|uniref:Uncharacterized protein n=1 Tax=Actinorhabdospora filicis TaxID=1785913 RepID=A0A9W6SKC5_9ACTN|nr:hypothetical protein [Actinorhabdospora filicis]GLZ77244.1 hypothetical protein Afil01_20510 [Actinorhabdospora filicis]
MPGNRAAGDAGTVALHSGTDVAPEGASVPFPSPFREPVVTLSPPPADPPGTGSAGRRAGSWRAYAVAAAIAAAAVLLTAVLAPARAPEDPTAFSFPCQRWSTELRIPFLQGAVTVHHDDTDPGNRHTCSADFPAGGRVALVLSAFPAPEDATEALRAEARAACETDHNQLVRALADGVGCREGGNETGVVYDRPERVFFARAFGHKLAVIVLTGPQSEYFDAYSESTELPLTDLLLGEAARAAALAETLAG